MKSIQLHDVADQRKLYTYLRELEEYTQGLEKTITSLRNQSSARPSTDALRYIRDQLQSDGVAPVNLTGLAGRSSEIQHARIPRVTSHPDPLTTDYDFYVLDSTPDELWTINRDVNPAVAEQIVATSANHNLLSATHPDTLAAAVVRGDLIVGNSTPKAARFALGTSKQGLRVNSGATDPEWSSLVAMKDTANTFTEAQTFTPGSGTSAINITAGQLTSSSQFGSSVIPAAPQSINNATWTSVVFDTEEFNRGPCHDNVTNNTRITVPTGGDGLWLILGQGAFAASATGIRSARIIANGSVVLGHAPTELVPTAGDIIYLPVMVPCLVAVATNYIELQVFQSSGAALNTDVAGTSTFLTFYRLC